MNESISILFRGRLRDVLVDFIATTKQVLLVGLFSVRGQDQIDATAILAEAQLLASIVKVHVAFVRPGASVLGCFPLLGHVLEVVAVIGIAGGADIALVAHLTIFCDCEMEISWSK